MRCEIKLLLLVYVGGLALQNRFCWGACISESLNTLHHIHCTPYKYDPADQPANCHSSKCSKCFSSTIKPITSTTKARLAMHRTEQRITWATCHRTLSGFLCPKEMLRQTPA